MPEPLLEWAILRMYWWRYSRYDKKWNGLDANLEYQDWYGWKCSPFEIREWCGNWESHPPKGVE